MVPRRNTRRSATSHTAAPRAPRSAAPTPPEDVQAVPLDTSPPAATAATAPEQGDRHFRDTVREAVRMAKEDPRLLSRWARDVVRDNPARTAGAVAGLLAFGILPSVRRAALTALRAGAALGLQAWLDSRRDSAVNRQ